MIPYSRVAIGVVLRWRVRSILGRFSWRQFDIDALLHHEPPAARRPFSVRVAELHVIVHKERWYQLRPRKISVKFSTFDRDENLHFHPTDVSTKAHPRPRAKSEEIPVHVAIVFYEPPLRFERINIVPEDLFLSMDNPGIGADDTSCWEILPCDLEATLWYYSR